MSYTTAAIMRSLDDAFEDDELYPDATLTGLCDNIVQPKMDRVLRPLGITLPIETPDASIKEIASMWTIGLMMTGMIGNYTAGDAEKGKRLVDEAAQSLQDIVDGKTATTHALARSRRTVTVPTEPESNLPEETVFAGGPHQWGDFPEQRES